MRLNLRLRTGHRVLRLIGGDGQLRPTSCTRWRCIPWEEYLDGDGYVSVSAATETPGIKDSRYAALKCKDAIADRIKNARGRRPNSGPDQGRAVVFLHWKDGKASIYFDTSGEPLPRRGYRLHPWRAPMQETLAAAVVLTTGWTGQGSFINPMCGSGTLAIEAALIARGARRAAADELRVRHLKDFDAALAGDRGRAEARGYPLERRSSRPISSRRRGGGAAGCGAGARGAPDEFGVCDFVDRRWRKAGRGHCSIPAASGWERAYLGSVYWTVGDF